MDLLEDKEIILILGNLISDKEIVVAVVLREFKEVNPEFESSFNDCEDYKQTLRNYYEGSGEFLEFYQYFLVFENNHLTNFIKVYQCDVVKFKLKNKKNEPSLSNFKSYLEIFHNKNWVEEKGDKVVIGDISVSNKKEIS